MNYGTCFIALEIDEKFLDVESHSLLLVTAIKALYPVTFYAIQLSALSREQKNFTASLELQVEKTIFWNS